MLLHDPAHPRHFERRIPGLWQLQKFSIVRLDEYICNTVQNRRIIIVLNLSAISACQEQIGANLQRIDDGAPAGAGQPPQPPQQPYGQPPPQQPPPPGQQQQVRTPLQSALCKPNALVSHKTPRSGKPRPDHDAARASQNGYAAPPQQYGAPPQQQQHHPNPYQAWLVVRKT
jgi:hypothetical protein